MNKLEKNENYNNKTFEDIKHIDEDGVEFWYLKKDNIQIPLSH